MYYSTLRRTDLHKEVKCVFWGFSEGRLDFLLFVSSGSVTCLLNLWKQTGIRKHGAFTRVAWWGGGLFVSYRWGGTREEGRC